MSTVPPATVGMSIDEIETPALVLDLDTFESNLSLLATKVREAGVRWRPHAKAHKSVDIALAQIALGASGVCCQKVSEAEVFADGGISDILVSNEVVGDGKLRRFAELSRRVNTAICVDDEYHVRALERAAVQTGTTLNVYVEVNVGGNRCGVAPGAPTAALARMVDRAPNLAFRGLQAYHGRAQHLRPVTERRAGSAFASESVLRCLEVLTADGIECPTVTGGGTGTFEFDARSGVYTEVQPGSYVFMDVDYAANDYEPTGARFGHSLFVLATVMSAPVAERAVVDAGLKAFAVDSGMPRVWSVPGVEIVRAADEHGTLAVDPSVGRVGLGDRLMLVPGHCDPTVNLHDWYVGVRRGVVERIWEVSARGRVM